jgi:site-specific DNA recombinase
MSTRVVIYARVSSDEQARGYSLQTQEESCRSFCAERDYEVLADFSDAHSGTELDRPGLNAAIDAVNALRPDVVVLHDVDRLGRETYVQAIAEHDLEKHGARIEYVLGGSDPLLIGIKKVIAVHENRQRNERSRRGMDGRVRAGYPLVGARPPYGYRSVSGAHRGHLEPDPEEAPIVRQMFQWCADEGLTTYAIAQRLHAQQIPTRGDASAVFAKQAGRCVWDPNTVVAILRDEVHKGLWHWNKTKRVKGQNAAGKDVTRQIPRPREEWMTVEVEPVVDVVTWERAQRRLAQNKARATRNAKRAYLLRGLVFCPCGRRWTGRYRNHLGRGFYVCPSTAAEGWRGACAARYSIDQAKLETAVLDAVKAFLSDPEVRRTALGAERDRVATQRAKLEDDLAASDKALASIDAQLGRVLDQALVGDLPRELVQAKSRDLMAQRLVKLAEHERQLAALAAPVADIETAIAELEPMVEAAFTAATADELRRLLELLHIEVQVEDKTHVRLSGTVQGPVAIETPSRR